MKRYGQIIGVSQNILKGIKNTMQQYGLKYLK